MLTNSYYGLDSQGFHKVVYYEWGDQKNDEVIVCVHGLLRNARDFDSLAQSLSNRYRIICPDMPGRGLSDKLSNPLDYSVKTYLADITSLLARLNVKTVHFIGTSMGGIIGMLLASLPNNPIRKLVLNDIGPEIPTPGLQNILDYGLKGSALRCQDLSELVNFLKKTYSSYQGISEAAWLALAEHSSWLTPNHQYQLAYDVKILDNVKIAIEHNLPAWPVWQSVQRPMILLHAEQSNILTQQTVEKMKKMKPSLIVKPYANMAHPVSLMLPEQIEYIRNWLQE